MDYRLCAVRPPRHRSEPAYFIFVALALICLALRVALHAVPEFVEIAEESRSL